MDKLDWSALEINHCPKCGEELPNALEELVVCNCGFRIRESRYKEIVKSLENREISGLPHWGDQESTK